MDSLGVIRGPLLASGRARGDASTAVERTRATNPCTDRAQDSPTLADVDQYQPDDL